MDATYIVDVTPENANEHTFFCIKNVKEAAHKNKLDWYVKRYKEGLRIKILKGSDDKMIGFIEFVSAKFAWRPVKAENFMFIHCMYVYPNKNKSKGFGSLLIKACEDEARKRGMAGICVMTSKGTWIAGSEVFEKNGFKKVTSMDRFDLLSLNWGGAKEPEFIDWSVEQSKYKGWHIVYADQCPWQEKSVLAIADVAHENGIDIKIKKIATPKQAQSAPSGFGVFALLKDGRLLEDHYISSTRFNNILKKELA